MLNQRIENAIMEILKEKGEATTYFLAPKVTGRISDTKVVLKQMEDDGLIREKSKDIWVINNKKEVKNGRTEV